MTHCFQKSKQHKILKNAIFDFWKGGTGVKLIKK